MRTIALLITSGLLSGCVLAHEVNHRDVWYDTYYYGDDYRYVDDYRYGDDYRYSPFIEEPRHVHPYRHYPRPTQKPKYDHEREQVKKRPTRPNYRSRDPAYRKYYDERKKEEIYRQLENLGSE